MILLSKVLELTLQSSISYFLTFLLIGFKETGWEASGSVCFLVLGHMQGNDDGLRLISIRLIC